MAKTTDRALEVIFIFIYFFVGEQRGVNAVCIKICIYIYIYLLSVFHAILKGWLVPGHHTPLVSNALDNR